jgi:Uma2 family endonuclease
MLPTTTSPDRKRKSALPQPMREPGRQPMSYEQYLAHADENRVMEWVNGEVITYMPPLLKHQIISRFLFRLLGDFVSVLQLGEVLYSPFEVKLWPDGPSREPDLFFVSQERIAQLQERRFNGAPDLVVEVVSPGSIREDKVRKFAEYEQAGVREYWLIDPRPRQETAEFFRRNEDGIYEAIEVGEDGLYQPEILPGFWFNVDWLWQEPLPNYQRLLAEILMEHDGLSPELRAVYRQMAALLG